MTSVSSAPTALEKPGCSVLQRLALIGALLLVTLTLRLYHVNYPPSDYHSWRQTQTLMIAKSYLAHDMNLFYPRVYWRNTVDNPMETEGVVGGTELQITPWLTAWLYKAFGTDYWVDRFVPITFSLLGVLFFFLLVERFTGTVGAAFGAALLSVSPMYLYFGRVHMPEAFALAASFVTLYYFDRWLDARRNVDFLVALLACALTLLGKPTMVLIALPMLYLVLLRHGWRFVLQWKFYLFGIVVSALFVAFNWHTFRVLPGVSGLMFFAPGLTNKSVLFTRDFYDDILRSIVMLSVGWPLLLLAVPGLLLPANWRACLPHWWCIGIIISILLAPKGNQINDYYQIVLAPPVAFLAGAGIARWLWWGPMRVAALALLAWGGFTSITLAIPMYTDKRAENFRAAGEWVREHSAEDVRILSSAKNPTAMYFAGRYGWTCWMEARGSIEFNEATIELTRQRGASLLLVPDGEKLDDAYFHEYRHIRDTLYESYWCHRGDNYAVFLMDAPADLSVPPDGRILFGKLGARKYLRGLWGKDYYAEPQQATYTDLRYNKSGSLRLDLPEGVTSIMLKLSSPVADNRLTVRFDGEEVALGTFPKAWAQADIVIPFETPPAPGRHTIELEVTQQRDKLVGLLLWMLQVQR